MQAAPSMVAQESLLVGPHLCLWVYPPRPGHPRPCICFPAQTLFLPGPAVLKAWAPSVRPVPSPPPSHSTSAPQTPLQLPPLILFTFKVKLELQSPSLNPTDTFLCPHKALQVLFPPVPEGSAGPAAGLQAVGDPHSGLVCLRTTRASRGGQDSTSNPTNRHAPSSRTCELRSGHCA